MRLAKKPREYAIFFSDTLFLRRPFRPGRRTACRHRPAGRPARERCLHAETSFLPLRRGARAARRRVRLVSHAILYHASRRMKRIFAGNPPVLRTSPLHAFGIKGGTSVCHAGAPPSCSERKIPLRRQTINAAQTFALPFCLLLMTKNFVACPPAAILFSIPPVLRTSPFITSVKGAYLASRGRFIPYFLPRGKYWSSPFSRGRFSLSPLPRREGGIQGGWA